MALVKPDQVRARRRQIALPLCLPLVKVKLTGARPGVLSLRAALFGAIIEAGPDPNESSFFPHRPLRARKLSRFLWKTKLFSSKPGNILSTRSKTLNGCPLQRAERGHFQQSLVAIPIV